MNMTIEHDTDQLPYVLALGLFSHVYSNISLCTLYRLVRHRFECLRFITERTLFTGSRVIPFEKTFSRILSLQWGADWQKDPGERENWKQFFEDGWLHWPAGQQSGAQNLSRGEKQVGIFVKTFTFLAANNAMAPVLLQKRDHIAQAGCPNGHLWWW